MVKVTTIWGRLGPPIYSAWDAGRDYYREQTGKDDFEKLPTDEQNKWVRANLNK